MTTNEARLAAEARTPVPVAVWAVEFSWLRVDEIDEATVPLCTDWRLAGLARCRLCEAFIPVGDRKPHAATHRRELAAYRRRRAADTRRINTSRLRKFSELRAGTRKAV